MADSSRSPVSPSVGPQVTTIRASEVKPEAMTYLWLDRVPYGTTTLVGGRPEMGKSLFTMYLAACVTQAGGSVLMANPEDQLANAIVPRLLAAGADPRLVHTFPRKLQLPADVGLLEELVRWHQISLVTIDPIAKHIRSNDPNTALEPLNAMAERTGCAVVGVHHLIKRLSKDAHPADAFGGASGGWLGTVRMAHVFGPVGGAEPEARFLANAKSNHRKRPPAIEFYVEGVDVEMHDGEVEEIPRLVFVGENADTKPGAVVQFKGGEQDAEEKPLDPSTRAVAAEFLTLLLVKGSVPANVVYAEAQKVGVSRKTCQRAADSLGVLRNRVGWGPGSHIEWSLPPGHPALKSVGKKAKKPKGTPAVDAAIDAILGKKTPKKP